MTEKELIDTELLVKCDKQDCKICETQATTLEMLLENDCEE